MLPHSKELSTCVSWKKPARPNVSHTQVPRPNFHAPVLESSSSARRHLLASLQRWTNSRCLGDHGKANQSINFSSAQPSDISVVRNYSHRRVSEGSCA